jgi:trehalose-phosphatase
VLSDFEQGVELRLRTANKGSAVQSLLKQLRSDFPIAYLGDDCTDEEVFRKLNGRGLTVLVRSVPRFTAAQVCLRPPTDLIQFLKNWILASGGDC